MSAYDDYGCRDYGAVKYVFGKSTCARCRKEYAINKTIWSDAEMARVCIDCANLPEVTDGY